MAQIKLLATEHGRLLSKSSMADLRYDEPCHTLGPNGLECTRAYAHDGPHVAHVDNEPVAMWVDVDRDRYGEYSLKTGVWP